MRGPQDKKKVELKMPLIQAAMPARHVEMRSETVESSKVQENVCVVGIRASRSSPPQQHVYAPLDGPQDILRLVSFLFWAH